MFPCSQRSVQELGWSNCMFTQKTERCSHSFYILLSQLPTHLVSEEDSALTFWGQQVGHFTRYILHHYINMLGKNPSVPFQHFTLKVFCQVLKELGFSFLFFLQQKLMSHQATLHPNTLNFLPRRIWEWLSF